MIFIIVNPLVLFTAPSIPYTKAPETRSVFATGIISVKTVQEVESAHYFLCHHVVAVTHLTHFHAPSSRRYLDP